MTHHYFATVSQGLEELAAKELEKLGADEIQTDFTGVSFTGDKALLYKVNLWSRIIFRVLMKVAEVGCYNSDDLYDNVSRINWDKYLKTHHTFSVHCTGKNQRLNHTHFTALTIKNAIVDQQQKRYNKRSTIDVNIPDIVINAHIHENQCILSLDSSGESLHRRGYRPAMGTAPLKETLAAALLELAEWTPDLPFLDPLCGSGILPIEAALKGLNIAPGLYRDYFCFENWQDFDESLWDDLLQDAEQQSLSELPSPIFGNDHDPMVLKQAKQNAKTSQIEKYIHFQQTELAQLEPPTDNGILICNPPYGKRLGNAQELGAFYKLLGDVFKQRFKGWTAYVLSGNRELAKQIGLRTARRMSVYNGSIPCVFWKYELY